MNVNGSFSRQQFIGGLAAAGGGTVNVGKGERTISPMREGLLFAFIISFTVNTHFVS